ncbi:MAG: tellurite resistance TerB family protein, partial [Nodosilinea sp.]
MTDSSISPAEALASIALVAIAADGYLTEQEGQDMTMLLSRMALFSSYSRESLHRLFSHLLRRLKQEGPGALVNQAKTVLPQD